MTSTAPTYVHDSLSFLQQAWNVGVWGLSYGDIVLAAGIVLTVLILRGLFARWILRILRATISRTRPGIGDAVADSLCEPLKFAFLIVGLDIAVRMVGPSNAAQALVNQAIQSLIAATVFWTLHRLTGWYA